MTNNPKHTIKLGSFHFQVINLSAPLQLNTEVFPGNPPPEREIFSTFEKHDCQHYVHRLGDHLFHPHGDAPNHQNPELSEHGFEHWGIDYAFNDATLIDLTQTPEAKEVDGIKFLTKITSQHLESFKDALHDKTAVVLRTGYDLWLKLNRKHNPDLIPYLDKGAAEILRSYENIRVIATDSLTIDRVGENICHRLLRDKFIVESMANLNLIPVANHHNFHLQTSPVAIVGATGGPVAAYAFIST